MISYTIENIISDLPFKIIDDASKSRLKLEFKQFVHNSHERFRFSKNLWSRNEPIDFYANYIPLTLIGRNDIIRVRNPLDVFDNHGKIAVIGNAGSGKTTLLRFLTLKAIEEGKLIPIYIELRLFSSQNLDFSEYVSKIISQTSYEAVNRVFKSGKFIFLLDGYDEINFSEGEQIISQIQNFITTNSENKFIISSRPGTNVDSLNDFYVYNLAELNTNDIETYISHLLLSRNQEELFYNSIKEDVYFQKYLTTPLFLSVYVDYILRNSDYNVPKLKSVFFRNILDTLFSKHDSVSKLGYVRNKLSGLNRDQLENIANMLAFRSLLLSINMFSKDLLIKELELIKRTQNLNFENDKLIYDLTIAANILLVDNDYYGFPHVVILEYLASSFIVRLPLEQKAVFYNQILIQDKLLVSPTLLSFLYELDAQGLVREYIIPRLEKTRYLFEKTGNDKTLDIFLADQFANINPHYDNSNLIEFLRKNFKIDNNSNLGELFTI